MSNSLESQKVFVLGEPEKVVDDSSSGEAKNENNGGGKSLGTNPDILNIDKDIS